MKNKTSEAVKRMYPMNLILMAAGLSSAAFYRKKSPKIVNARPGPKTDITDEQLLVEIRKEIREGLFLDEGSKKMWKRLRRKGIKASKGRVHRVMRDNNLLSVTRPKPERKVREHTGSIKTEMPNRMWGTDGKKFYTRQEGWCWFFGIIDHFNDEIISWHANQSGTRFDALEPLRMAVKKTFGTVEQHICTGTGLFLRSDHGSQYDSRDFQKELRFLGLVYSPAFVRSPQCNGIIERFHRTLDEQVFDLHEFESLEEARKVIGQFIENYNRHWLIHRLGLTSPLDYREAHEKSRKDAA
jgi:transposase InsO family protein